MCLMQSAAQAMGWEQMSNCCKRIPKQSELDPAQIQQSALPSCHSTLAYVCEDSMEIRISST